MTDSPNPNCFSKLLKFCLSTDFDLKYLFQIDTAYFIILSLVNLIAAYTEVRFIEWKFLNEKPRSETSQVLQ
jgi:hypothetical protein